MFTPSHSISEYKFPGFSIKTARISGETSGSSFVSTTDSTPIDSFFSLVNKYHASPEKYFEIREEMEDLERQQPGMFICILNSCKEFCKSFYADYHDSSLRKSIQKKLVELPKYRFIKNCNKLIKDNKPNELKKLLEDTPSDIKDTNAIEKLLNRCFKTKCAPCLDVLLSLGYNLPYSKADTFFDTFKDHQFSGIYGRLQLLHQAIVNGDSDTFSTLFEQIKNTSCDDNCKNYLIRQCANGKQEQMLEAIFNSKWHSQINQNTILNFGFTKVFRKLVENYAEKIYIIDRIICENNRAFIEILDEYNYKSKNSFLYLSKKIASDEECRLFHRYFPNLNLYPHVDSINRLERLKIPYTVIEEKNTYSSSSHDSYSHRDRAALRYYKKQKNNPSDPSPDEVKTCLYELGVIPKSIRFPLKSAEAFIASGDLEKFKQLPAIKGTKTVIFTLIHQRKTAFLEHLFSSGCTIADDDLNAFYETFSEPLPSQSPTATLDAFPPFSFSQGYGRLLSLFNAIKKDDIETVRAVLTQSPALTIDKKSEEIFTAFCINKKRHAILRLLLEHHMTCNSNDLEKLLDPEWQRPECQDILPLALSNRPTVNNWFVNKCFSTNNVGALRLCAEKKVQLSDSSFSSSFRTTNPELIDAVHTLYPNQECYLLTQDDTTAVRLHTEHKIPFTGESVDYFIEKGFENAFETAVKNKTPVTHDHLSLALQKNRTKMACSLIYNGVKPDDFDIFAAIQTNDLEVVRAVHEQISYSDIKPLIKSLYIDSKNEIVLYLLENGPELGLEYACLCLQDPECFKKALKGKTLCNFQFLHTLLELKDGGAINGFGQKIPQRINIVASQVFKMEIDSHWFLNLLLEILDRVEAIEQKDLDAIFSVGYLKSEDAILFLNKVQEKQVREKQVREGQVQEKQVQVKQVQEKQVQVKQQTIPSDTLFKWTFIFNKIEVYDYLCTECSAEKQGSICKETYFNEYAKSTICDRDIANGTYAPSRRYFKPQNHYAEKKLPILIEYLKKKTPSELRTVACDKNIKIIINHFCNESYYGTIKIADTVLLEEYFLKICRESKYWNVSVEEILASKSSEKSLWENPEYKQLLDYTTNACKEEKNNGEKLHAEKLTLLFGSYDEAINYIKAYKEKHPKNPQPVHDACLFELPKTGYWTPSIWKQFIQNKNYSPKSMQLLPHASILEHHINGIRLQDPTTPHIDPDFSQALTPLHTISKNRNEKRKQLGIEIKKHTNHKWSECEERFPREWKALLQTHQNRLSSKGDKNAVSNAKKALDNPLWHELADTVIQTRDIRACSIDSLNKITCDILFKDIDPKHYDMALKYARYGVPAEKVREAIELLEHPKKSDFIPHITIDGSEIGYPEYEFKKLELQDPNGLILGHLTGCCQHINGHARDCALHGQTSPYGGFWVLRKKESQTIIAQSWVALTESGELVADSIERDRRFDEKMIIDFYEAAAKKVIESRKDISAVLVGSGGATPNLKNRFSVVQQPYSRIIGYKQVGYDSCNTRYLLSKQQDAPTQSSAPHFPIDDFWVNNEAIDTYVKDGAKCTTLTLSPQKKAQFFKAHKNALTLLQSHKNNPLLEEGYNEKDRERYGESFIPFTAAKKIIEKRIVEKAKKHPDTYQVGAVVFEENNQQTLVQKLQSNEVNDALKNGQNVLIGYTGGIHFITALLRINNGKIQAMIVDPEPDSGYSALESALLQVHTECQLFVTKEHLQKDFFSCTTIGIKALSFFAKHGTRLFDTLTSIGDGQVTRLSANQIPAGLYKLTQAKKVPESCLTTIVSQGKHYDGHPLTLQEYLNIHKKEHFSHFFNTAAIRKKYRYLQLLKTA